MSLPRILLLDDDPSVHKAVEFRLRGFAEVSACTDAAGALALASGKSFDAALIDVNLNEAASGIDTVVALRAVDPDLAPVIFTARTDYGTALDAFRVHAFDFVPKSLRQDEEFRVKLNEAIAHTRARRQLSQTGSDAGRLRAELRDAIIRNELEITTSDIQRGLLTESLESFSALLGRIELIDLHLHQRLVTAPDLTDLAQLASRALAELQEYVDNLRDYFAEPERAASSVNGILTRASEIVREELPPDCAVVMNALRLDHPIAREGRALLRVVVTLCRLAAGGVGHGQVSVTPATALHPALELESLKRRPTARVLRTTEFRKEEKKSLLIEITGPARETDVDSLAALFSPDNHRGAASAAWTALAMLARVGAALVVEARTPGGVRFTIVMPA